jgi:hypothetical protein
LPLAKAKPPGVKALGGFFLPQMRCIALATIAAPFLRAIDRDKA